MYIIPAIDIIDGKCVRLVKGDYTTKKEYSTNPLQVAKSFEQAGLTKLHLVDLDGAKKRRVTNLKVLEEIATQTSLDVDFGGGVQSNQDIENVFAAGARQVTAGSIAISNPDMLEDWLHIWGSDKIILGADISSDKIAINAWERESSYSWEVFLKEKIAIGVESIISTDVQKDGMLAGPSFSMYEKMQTLFPKLKIIASGGVSSQEDLRKLKDMGLHGAIIGKAYYEGRVTLEEMRSLNNS